MLVAHGDKLLPSWQVFDAAVKDQVTRLGNEV